MLRKKCKYMYANIKNAIGIFSSVNRPIHEKINKFYSLLKTFLFARAWAGSVLSNYL